MTVEEIFFPQGDLVRQMREQCASEADIKEVVAELKARKRVLEAKVRSGFINLLPSFTSNNGCYFFSSITY